MTVQLRVNPELAGQKNFNLRDECLEVPPEFRGFIERRALTSAFLFIGALDSYPTEAASASGWGAEFITEAAKFATETIRQNFPNDPAWKTPDARPRRELSVPSWPGASFATPSWQRSPR